MNCVKCRFKENNGVPCLVPCFNLNIPPENCRFFQMEKKKMVVNQDQDSTAADDYLDYLHDRW